MSAFTAQQISFIDQQIGLADSVLDAVSTILTDMQGKGATEAEMMVTAVGAIRNSARAVGRDEVADTFLPVLIARAMIRLMRAGEGAGKTQV